MTPLEDARRRVAQARAVAVLTGAGISAESGVPTFRGPGGVWRDRRPEDLATPEAFERDPRLVWEWYAWRRGLIAAAEPNLGHYALVTLEKRAAQFTLVTQNVDGLHARAGSREVLELHGSLWRTRCLSCGEVKEDRRVPLDRLPPRCACEGVLRPDVVWFGEPLPVDVVRRAWRALEQCDVLIVAGTSGVVQPAASLAEIALGRGAAVVEVNLEPTPLTERATVALQGKSGELLPQLLQGPGA
ncbi:MAG TPA: NAD-dependent deacylase [Planctomycetota bacterium]|nr:NAD-dependent deacylase [Planctomycetota bacterium]